jgi:hypothetical protein
MKLLSLLQPKSLILAAFVAGTPITIGVVATLTGLAATPAVAIDVIDFGQKWVVSVNEARALIANGALVLDARNADLKTAAPLKNAQAIRWRDLSNTSGQISTDDAAISLRLQALGVDAGQPIVVLADPFQGLGEDAEVVWALRSLGHDRVVMVDGGLPALLVAGVPQIQSPHGQGRFVVDRRDDWSIDRHAVSRDLVRLEARSMSELLTDDGQLKPLPEIAAWLAAKGIDHDTALATDSAWLTTVLIDAGYHARQVVGASEYALTAAN